MPDYDSPNSINVNVGGALEMGSDGTSTTIYIGNSYDFRDDLTWIKGRHTIRFGGEIMPMHFLQRFLGVPGFNFNGSRSGDPIADFMMGAFASASVAFGDAQNDDVTVSPDAYIQDQFKMTPRLTLTYGVRWEPELFWHDKYNRIDTFKQGEQSKVVPDAPPGIVFPGDPGITRTIVPAKYHNFAPRLGFAWDVTGNGKTSVRGAYGVFFEQLNADTMAQQNPPYTGVVNEYNGLFSDPFGSVGATPPPAVLTGKFGCVPISTPPGVNCPLFPLPALGYFVDGTLTTPYWQGWNLDIQRQLTASTMLEVSYVGKDGIKLNNLRDFNPAAFTPGTTYNATTGVETTISSAENVNNRALFEPGIIAPLSWTLGNDYRSWYHACPGPCGSATQQGVVGGCLLHALEGRRHVLLYLRGGRHDLGSFRLANSPWPFSLGPPQRFCGVVPLVTSGQIQRALEERHVGWVDVQRYNHDSERRTDFFLHWRGCTR